jgi:phosphatidylserine/phosphatidylglycerophosphate/cardiolipin synthase-like enzyme
MTAKTREQGIGSKALLGLTLAAFTWLASCGGGTLCHAQAAQAPVAGAIFYGSDNLATVWPLLGTAYSPGMNIEHLDAAAIGSAKKWINLAAFSLTDQVVIDAIKDRAAHGVLVRIYLDRGELQAACREDITCQRSPIHELMNLPGVDIRVKHSKVLMHLKSYAVDTALVRDGSANFSVQGESRQDNSATFSADPKTVEGFGLKFREMWARPDNLTVAQAVQAK